jgi:signal transduction histidine kinase
MELNEEIVKMFDVAADKEFTDLLMSISNVLCAATGGTKNIEFVALWNMPCRNPLYLSVKPGETPVEIDFDASEKSWFAKWKAGEESGFLYFAEERPTVTEFVLDAISTAVRINAETTVKKVEWGVEAAARILGITYHDVRNTFGAITGTMQLLEMDMGENEKIKNSSNSIRDIFNRFDDANKTTMQILRNEQVVYENGMVDVSSIYNTILNKNKKVYAYSQVDLDFKVEPNIKTKGDEHKIAQILSELLFNAADSIEICGNGGKISVNVSVVDSKCVINVKDTGFGMDYDSQRYLTMEFFTRKYKRMGMGLVRIRRFAEDWGGYLQFTSKPQFGTSVTACFPLIL